MLAEPGHPTVHAWRFLMSFPFLPGPRPTRKPAPITQVPGPNGGARRQPPAWQAARPPATPTRSQPALHPRAKSGNSRLENFPAGRGRPRSCPTPRQRGRRRPGSGTAPGAAAGGSCPRGSRGLLGGPHRPRAPGGRLPAGHLPRRRLWRQGRAAGAGCGPGAFRAAPRMWLSPRFLAADLPPAKGAGRRDAPAAPPAAAAPSRGVAGVRSPGAASSGAASSAPGLSPLSGRGPGPSLRHLPRSLPSLRVPRPAAARSQSRSALLSPPRRRRRACARPAAAGPHSRRGACWEP